MKRQQRYSIKSRFRRCVPLRFHSALRLNFVLVVVSGFWGAMAQEAQQTPKSGLEQFLEQDYLFGTWGGVRKELSEKGVDFEFFYITSNLRNLSGGIKTGSAYEGALLMLLDLDSQK